MALSIVFEFPKVESEIVFEAARDGNLSVLKTVLDDKPVNELSVLVSATTNGATPLVVACRNGHLDVVMYLLETGVADVEQSGYVDFSEAAPPLWWAAYAGHLDVVETLVENNASVNCTTQREKRTPLFIACFHEKYEVAKYLIEHGADIELACSFNYTCLMITCSKGHVEFFKYLLECGANINRKSNSGFTAMHACIQSGNLEILETLVKNNALVNSTTNKEKRTPLFIACFDEKYEVAKYLIEHGADIELACSFNYTCLMITCSTGHVEFFKYLLECGANINRKSNSGFTALHACVQSGNLEILEMLLERGARIKADKSGKTPLLEAAYKGKAPIVEYFVNAWSCKKRHKVSALELLGATSVDDNRNIVAARNYWKRAMELRYEDGAPPLEKPDEEGPLSYYIDATEFRTFQQLENLTADEIKMQALLIRERIMGPRHYYSQDHIINRYKQCVNNGRKEICIRLGLYLLDLRRTKYLIELQSDQNNIVELIYEMIAEASDVRAVSFHDIYRVFESAMKTFERFWGVYEMQDHDGSRTKGFHNLLLVVMHLISIMCRLKPYLKWSEETLLKKAADKLVHSNLKGINGCTPLHFACYRYSESEFSNLPATPFPCPEVVDLLLKAGAVPNSRDLNNNTPLHMASMNQPFPLAVFNILLSQGAHFDLCNNENKTPLQLVDNASISDIHPVQHLSLQCLCAHKINKHKIPYNGLITKNLCEFIDLHAKHYY